MSKKQKLNNVAVDFQPDAVEIAMRPVPFIAKLGVWIGVTFFFGSLIAAYFSEVDVIVNGTGKLVPKDQNIVMKPLDRTVIKSIEVKVGEEVKAGQVLMTFDPAINKAEEDRLKNDHQTAKAQYDRWNAEYRQIEYVPGENANGNEKLQRDIFQWRKNYYNAKIRAYDEADKRTEDMIGAYEEELLLAGKRLVIAKNQLTREKELEMKKATTKDRVDAAEDAVLERKTVINSLEKNIADAKHQKESNLAEKQTFISEWRKDIGENFEAAKNSLNTISKSLEKVLQLNRYIQLTAPCDAVVLEIASFPVGSAVREAEALITLVPTGGTEVEAEIPAQDRGKVKIGDTVRVKLNAFPFQKHGTLDGVIREISPDAFQKQPQETGTQATSAAYYRVWITLSGKLRNVPEDLRLTPGMEVQAEIKVGTRSVLEYIIHPLVKSLDEAIREP